MSVRPLLIGVAAATVALAAFGCATIAPPPANPALVNLTQRENLPGKPGCFLRSNFTGDWTVLDDTTLIVRAPLPKDPYVIKLFEPVTDLQFKQHLGFEDREHTGQICNTGDDYLVLRDWQRRVPIVAVHTLTMDDENRLLQAAGKPLQHPPGAAAPASR